MSSADFYDNYISHQAASGINDRIYGLYKRLRRIGLNTDSNVLEIGCGIGALTFLLTRSIKRGRIEVMDLSPASIDFLTRHLKKPNLFVSSGDILHYIPDGKAFDMILAFDVLEHIPREKHAALFERIVGWMNANTLLLINIPNPGYILYDQQHNPATLQELDQPLFINELTQALSNASLELLQFETYSVWAKNDYQFMVIKKQAEFREELLSKKRSLWQKIVNRFARQIRKLKFRYP